MSEVRGLSVAGIFVQLGFLFEYLLGTVTGWRTAAVISATVPIVTVIAITQVRGRVSVRAKDWLDRWLSRCKGERLIG
jgi:hypothetical protein